MAVAMPAPTPARGGSSPGPSSSSPPRTCGDGILPPANQNGHPGRRPVFTCAGPGTRRRADKRRRHVRAAGGCRAVRDRARRSITPARPPSVTAVPAVRSFGLRDRCRFSPPPRACRRSPLAGPRASIVPGLGRRGAVSVRTLRQIMPDRTIGSGEPESIEVNRVGRDQSGFRLCCVSYDSIRPAPQNGSITADGTATIRADVSIVPGSRGSSWRNCDGRIGVGRVAPRNGQNCTLKVGGHKPAVGKPSNLGHFD